MMSVAGSILRAVASGNFGAIADYLQQLVLQSSAARAVTYSGSGTAYTNPGPYLQTVTISGGTVTVITLSNGGVTGLTAGQFVLRPGDSVTCTSSGNPTVFNVTDLV